jgi:hypothetical protein
MGFEVIGICSKDAHLCPSVLSLPGVYLPEAGQAGVRNIDYFSQ